MKNNATPEVRFEGFEEDWEEKTLGEVMEVTSVKRIHRSDWTTKGVRFLRARDIVSASKNEEAATKLYISKEKYEEYSAISGKLSIGDMLVTGVGSIGIPFLITDKTPLYFKDGNVIWFKNKSIDGNYFYYAFIGLRIQKYIKDVAGIGTVGTYTISSGRQTPLCIPTFAEQQKIGEFFKNLDETIAIAQKQLSNLQQAKKGFLQKMFPKDGEKKPEVRFGGFEEDWEEKTLGEISKKQYGGGTPKTAEMEFWTGNIPWIQSSDLKQDKVFSVSAKKLITKIAVESSATKIVPQNSIAIVTRVGYGKLAYMQNDYATSQDFFSLSELMLNGWFATYSIYKLLKEDANNTQGTSIKGVTKNDLLSKCIFVPNSVEEQQKIGEFFKNLDELIAIAQKQLSNLQQAKKGFLQKMFV